ncbi:methyl-accepting chemotaxis protein [Shimia ponticola]|uniref:methyl-accepting chemotaxis protein n=1 Tax=Shimia ponticola TaxID=2582893 RepID=UPI0011BE0AE3|nr:methyl-accepting chemotaxis protein [Shimia ponticola]
MTEARPADVVALLTTLRAAQGFALNVGAIVIEVATAPEDERRSLHKLVQTFCAQFDGAVTAILANPLMKCGDERMGPWRADLDSVSAAFASIPQPDEVIDMTPEMAAGITRCVRVRGVPAILDMTAWVRGFQKEAEAAKKALNRERMAALDSMFSEVEQIGRMIHLISLNASVEAARAGGESGRSFKVIADEIRSLAQQSATLIDTTRASVRGDGAGGLDAI